MSLNILGDVIGAVGNLASDLITTDKERLQLQIEERRLDLEAAKVEAGLLTGQIETNKIEAASPSLFIGGWRPAVGWVGVVALALAYIPKALVLSAIWTWQACLVVSGWSGLGVAPALPAYPDLGVADIIGLLGSLLGFGALRSWDKRAEVDSKAVGKG